MAGHWGHFLAGVGRTDWYVEFELKGIFYPPARAVGGRQVGRYIGRYVCRSVGRLSLSGKAFFSPARAIGMEAVRSLQLSRLNWS